MLYFGKTDSKTYTITANAKGTATITVQPTDYESTDGETALPKANTISVTVNAKESNPNTNNNTDKNTNTPPKNNTTPNNNTNPNPNTETENEVTFSKTSGTVYALQDNTNLRGSATTKENNVIKSLKKGTEMTITAKSDSKVDGYYWYKVSVNGVSGFVATSLVTNTKPKETEIPTLSSLTVSPGGISPAFSKGTTTYNVSVESEVERVTVKATGEAGSTVKITCNGSTISNGIVPINEGLNTIKIQVTKGGETNTYTVYVRKAIAEDEEGNIREEEKETSDLELFLESLEIVGLNISPEFNKETYSYTVEIPADDDRTALEINAVANAENAKIEIIDNENLEYGENIITIMVTSEDGKETRTYQIVVNKIQPTTVNATSGDVVNANRGILVENKIPILIICVLIIIAIVCLVFIIKTSKKEDDFEKQLEEDEGQDEEEQRKDILDSEIPENAYETNQYLNELRDKENINDENAQRSTSTEKTTKGKHF